MLRVISGVLSVLVFLSVNTITGQCLSKDGRTKLMPFGDHLMGLQKKQDSLQLAILSTKYMCIEQGDKSNIEFSDGSYIYLSNLLELNCDGKAYFNLSNADIRELGTKEISKVVLGSKFKGYTSTALPIEDQSMEFRNLINCIINEEIPPSVILESEPLASSTTSPPINEEIKINEATTSNNSAVYSAPVIVEAPPLPLRYVQFIASSGGKTYNELSHLGTIISEQVPNKNLYRYKIQGPFSDSDIQRVIAALAAEGFKGAFEAK